MVSKNDIIELYRKCATELPEDVYSVLKNTKEQGLAREVLDIILKNIKTAKKESKPICQDTGTPIFYIKDGGISQYSLIQLIEEATVIATDKVPLRPNAVDIISGKNIGNKPIIYFQETYDFKIDLLMKGGGSENISHIYTLPNQKLNANRDFQGIRKCVLDAVFKAQGKACPPYMIGVAIGGNEAEVAHLSKKQLIRNLYDINNSKKLKQLEDKLLLDINELDIGPAGFGGKTTALSVKIGTTYRHPASFFVGVSFSCWALRRASYER